VKISVVDLKTNLSKVLREIQSNGETLEVCVRESPVAYLTPILPKNEEASPMQDIRRLTNRLHDSGLILEAPQEMRDVVTLPKNHRAGDGRVDISTTSDMRAMAK